MTTKRVVSLGKPTRAEPTIFTRDDSVVKKERACGEKESPSFFPPIKGGKRGPTSANQVWDEIVERIPRLSERERKQLLTHLALLEQTQSAPTRDLDMWTTSVQTALSDAIAGGDGAGVGIMPLRRMLGARSAWAPVENFMRVAKLSELAVTERNAVYGVLAALLVDHARGIARYAGVPLSGKFVSNCTGDIAAIFDQAFPGYVSSGMAAIVIRRAQ